MSTLAAPHAADASGAPAAAPDPADTSDRSAGSGEVAASDRPVGSDPVATSGDVAVPFSVRIREATRAEHGAAESTGFIARLMGGELSEGDYWRLIAQYLPVYEALEARVEELAETSPLVASFHDPRLARSTAIRHDLATRFGDDAAIEVPLPITEDYAQRIRHADAPRLLAHHYLRYLGDLSGGQAIGALVARHYGVPRAQLSIWDFSEIDAPKRVKDAYRLRLDSITDPADQEAFLDESRTGYRLAGDLFSALGEAGGAAR